MTAAEMRALGSPDDLNLPLQALWFDAHDNWSMAHGLCQLADNREGDWVHAYLHRQAGDGALSRHWYERADVPVPALEFDAGQEWTAIAEELLRRAAAEPPKPPEW